MLSDRDLALRMHRQENARASRKRSQRTLYNPTAEAAKPQLSRKKKVRKAGKVDGKVKTEKRLRTVSTPRYLKQPFHIQDGKERTVWYAGTVTKVKGKQGDVVVVRWMDGDVTDVDQWAAKLRSKYLVPLTRKQWAAMSGAYDARGSFKPVTQLQRAQWSLRKH